TTSIFSSMSSLPSWIRCPRDQEDYQTHVRQSQSKTSYFINYLDATWRRNSMFSSLPPSAPTTPSTRRRESGLFASRGGEPAGPRPERVRRQRWRRERRRGG